MARLVRFERSDGYGDVYINPDHVAAVTIQDEQAVIHLAVSAGDGAKRYTVTESQIRAVEKLSG